ncbi:MAG: translation initiation factor [Duncaniella sp.]|nr:translation initiation factor [Duncaniella sp.]
MMDWKDILGSKVESGELPAAENSDEILSEDAPVRKTDTLRVVIDRKGRKGKTATIVEGFTCDEASLKAVAAKLKTRLGTGGSARAGEILIQGERADDIREILREMGYKVK